ncbi:NOL1/NOP2/Sun domain member 3 [Trebouxia sp. C0010 RCD-2024]
MCSAPGGKSLMLAYMLFAQKGPPTTALQTASSSHDHAHATPETSAHNNSTLTSFASTSPQHEPLSSNKTDGLPQDRRLSSQVESAAASAPHEQAASVLHLSQLQGSVRTDATDLAEHNALAEPGSVSEAACMPATLSAQHGQNVALCGSLTCNELDAARRSRLQGVLDAYLPAPLKRKVRVTPHDAARYWTRFEADTYDCILLDAPCTSERHVVQQAASDAGRGAKTRWSLQQCKDMAVLQVKLLTAALKAVKPGGRVVYSTCSVSPLENDEVVSKALANVPGQMQLGTSTAVDHQHHEHASGVNKSVLDSLPGLVQQLGAEPTQHGLMILPDQAAAGPMFVCLLLKNT